MTDDARSPAFTAAETATLRSLEQAPVPGLRSPAGRRRAALPDRARGRRSGALAAHARVLDPQRRKAVRVTVRIRLARTTDELDQVFALRHRVMVDEEGYMPAQPDGRLADRFDAYPTTANVIALVDGRSSAPSASSSARRPARRRTSSSTSVPSCLRRRATSRAGCSCSSGPIVPRRASSSR